MLMIEFCLSHQAENQGVIAINLWVQSPRNRSANVQRQERTNISAQEESESNIAFLHLFDLIRPPVDWMMTHWEGRVFFTQSTTSNANLFQKHPHRTPRNKVLLTIWASFIPVKIIIKYRNYI